VPRHNKPRSIASEANVAERITYEREGRGLSYEALAKLMTDEGCPLVGSAIYRIEKGDPPRHITVDEVVAFARVFGTTVPKLLAPMEFVRKESARKLVERTDKVYRTLPAATSKFYNLCKEIYALRQSDPDLHEFFANQWLTAANELPSVRLTPEVGAALTEFTKIVQACASADAAASSSRARSASGKRTGKVGA
jgi:transcriptional regulator with XRE-family HTH domain